MKRYKRKESAAFGLPMKEGGVCVLGFDLAINEVLKTVFNFRKQIQYFKKECLN